MPHQQRSNRNKNRFTTNDKQTSSKRRSLANADNKSTQNYFLCLPVCSIHVYSVGFSTIMTSNYWSEKIKAVIKRAVEIHSLTSSNEHQNLFSHFLKSVKTLTPIHIISQKNYITIKQYRAHIRTYNKSLTTKEMSTSKVISWKTRAALAVFTCSVFGSIVYVPLLLRMANDVEENPGPTLYEIIDPKQNYLCRL